MAVKISEMAAASEPLSGSELVEIVQAGATRRTTVGALAGSANFPAVDVKATTTVHNLVLADTGKYLRFTSATDVTVNLQDQSSVSWLANTEIHFEQSSSGKLIFTALPGVTLLVNGAFLARTRGQYAVATLKRVDLDTWILFGILEPA